MMVLSAQEVVLSKKCKGKEINLAMFLRPEQLSMLRIV